ncbi:MAG: hypothetical protein ACRD3Q_00285, partial [Terriglobales bacterium]
MNAHASRQQTRDTALRSTAPVGVNAEFVAALCAERSLSRTTEWWRRIPKRATTLTPVLGRRAKGAFLLFAVLCAVLLTNFSADPHSGSHVGASPVAHAGLFDDCKFLQPACTAIKNVLSAVTNGILDGLSALVSDAINPNNFCDRTEMSPDRPDTGFSGFILSAAQNKSEFFQSYNANAGTTWSKYGAAGTDWNTYFLDCLAAGNIVNYAAGAVLGFSKIISVIAIVIFQQTFNSGLLNIFLGGNPPPVATIIERLHVKVYEELAALAIVIGALVLAYRAILKGFGLADFLSKFVMMVAVSGLATVFFNNAVPLIKWGNEQTNLITNTVMTALRGNECRNSEGKQIELNQVDCTAESIYNTLVYVPWANGEVGSLSVSNNNGTAENKQALAARILDQQAFT